MNQQIQTNQGQAATTTAAAGKTTIAGDGIVIDKNKSKEQYIAEAEIKYIIPALVREKFPDLVKLIYETESMNDEERKYWMQIMPIMSEDQIVKFRDILINERDQLAKLDQEYQQEIGRINNSQNSKVDEIALKAKLHKIKAEEKSIQASEQKQEEDLLKQLENI